VRAEVCAALLSLGAEHRGAVDGQHASEIRHPILHR
jgi:hypothetical protein